MTKRRKRPDARVDWLRVLQCGAAMARRFRGDDPGEIYADNMTQVQRVERIEQSIKQFARQAAGCNFTPRCTCVACAFEPIVAPQSQSRPNAREN